MMEQLLGDRESRPFQEKDPKHTRLQVLYGNPSFEPNAAFDLERVIVMIHDALRSDAFDIKAYINAIDLWANQLSLTTMFLKMSHDAFDRSRRDTVCEILFTGHGVFQHANPKDYHFNWLFIKLFQCRPMHQSQFWVSCLLAVLLCSCLTAFLLLPFT
jgi:hypothetical protein